MKNTSQEPDRFEIAAMQTLAKVNKIGSYVNEVTIGPNAKYVEWENGFENDLQEKTSPCSLEKPKHSDRKLREDEEKENDLLFSYAAKALREMENLRQLNVFDDVNERASKLLSVENELLSRMSENLKLSKEEMNIKNKLKSKMIESSIHNDDLALTQKMSELIKRYMDEKLKSEEKSEEEAKVHRDEEIRLKNERIVALSRIDEEYHGIYKQILDNTANCKNRAKLISLSSSDFLKIQELANNLNAVLQRVNSGNVLDQDVETCQIMLQCISVISDKLKNNAELINFEEEERVAREQLVAQTQETSSVIIPEVVEEIDSEPISNANAENKVDLEKCICKELLEYYSGLCDKFNEFSKHVETFVNSVPSRSFLRQLKIAIGTPVNAVSSNDTAHMRDKFIKISQFLRGNFTLPGTPMPNLSKDSYYVFVIDHLCKNIISHAENRFTLTAPREAQLMASLALAIWSEFPEFGPILITNILKKCPYAIPAYWPKYSDQSDQEYYLSIGYKCKNNEIEDGNSFTTRMTGIFMLYVSLMVTPGRRNRPHPFGIENAWKWIAAMLNLEPHPNFAVVTAELLYVFLHTCGHRMHQCYGIQFRKIVQLLIDEYIAKIEKITPADFRGPVSRLELYIVENDVLRKGFREPRELLSAEDWM